MDNKEVSPPGELTPRKDGQCANCGEFPAVTRDKKLCKKCLRQWALEQSPIVKTCYERGQ